jgi:hypothetical protein
MTRVSCPISLRAQQFVNKELKINLNFSTHTEMQFKDEMEAPKLRNFVLL